MKEHNSSPGKILKNAAIPFFKETLTNLATDWMQEKLDGKSSKEKIFNFKDFQQEIGMENINTTQLLQMIFCIPYEIPV